MLATLPTSLLHLPGLNQARLSRLGAVALVILLGYQAAQLTWRALVPAVELPAWQRPQATETGQKKPATVAIAPLQRLDLFGKVQRNQPKPVTPQPVVDEAPKTRLKLKLLGVMATADGLGGIAIIESAGKQDVYGVGDKLANGQAQLAQIHSDRILLQRGERLETLMLEGESRQRRTSAPTAAAPGESTGRKEVDKRNDEALIQTLAQKREELTTVEGISQYLRIAPVQGQGGIRGYRLRPGRSAELFRLMGLRNGDIAVSINGYDLTDQSQALQVLAELPDAQEATITVERQGQLVDMLFTLPQ